MVLRLAQGDCLDLMHAVTDHSVDMILCDLPYGVTACKWDSVIPLASLWWHYKRIIKRNGAIVLTASQPFTSALVMSNVEMFKYEWIWEKTRASGFLHAKNKPLRAHESVLVFSAGTTVHEGQSENRMVYNPQMTSGKPYERRNIDPHKTGRLIHRPSEANFKYVGTDVVNEGVRYPRSVQTVANHNVGNIHPTQKPVALMEYLVRTYTNEGELVMDNCMGSGTTGVACAQSGRRFVGFEKDATFFRAAEERVRSAYQSAGISI